MNQGVGDLGEVTRSPRTTIDKSALGSHEFLELLIELAAQAPGSLDDHAILDTLRRERLVREQSAAEGFSRRLQLTDRGQLLLDALLGILEEAAPTPARTKLLPRWDSQTRELWFGAKLVKRYRRPANNQEAVLAAFQRSGWPQQILDPLPPVPGIKPAIRLHDTIKCMNRSLHERVLRF